MEEAIDGETFDSGQNLSESIRSFQKNDPRPHGNGG
jgi:hypothetical protein